MLNHSGIKSTDSAMFITVFFCIYSTQFISTTLLYILLDKSIETPSSTLVRN